ncbi:hypothetical protein GGS26DRAFT_212695 [Hypomontagnella submonticulosa]|nr:hypothetical protein GGS26DRAFT_212695 [Hypomontagnella submonticulosa]
MKTTVTRYQLCDCPKAIVPQLVADMSLVSQLILGFLYARSCVLPLSNPWMTITTVLALSLKPYALPLYFPSFTGTRKQQLQEIVSLVIGLIGLCGLDPFILRLLVSIARSLYGGFAHLEQNVDHFVTEETTCLPTHGRLSRHPVAPCYCAAVAREVNKSHMTRREKKRQLNCLPQLLKPSKDGCDMLPPTQLFSSVRLCRKWRKRKIDVNGCFPGL